MSENTAERKMLEDLDCIETYITEHGQDQGTVSWQMAWSSIKRVRSLIEKAMVCTVAEVIEVSS